MSDHSHIPLHEPVGKETENWTSLTDKEAKVRAKAVEKGHEPHDWRHMANKILHTNKAYPEEARGALDITPTSKKEAAAQRTTDIHDSNDAVRDDHNLTGDQQFRSNEQLNRTSHSGNTTIGGEQHFAEHERRNEDFQQERRHEGFQHSAQTQRQDMNNPSQLGCDQTLDAPANAPEMVGGRDHGTKPITRTNFVV
ncbi:SubName: Full=Uncharacterized protein {ECO:0000313/EMBL:CCA75560.1} [Serendipita indica DSM 11827]|uniref:Uncharacterized protein n=1 Tax=Serendipita indica (strain DSM 11827) TaxID=1109443 RepID=G4TW67_SERID|nr:SubName: Full=Uncharacterized protein {ECO:0000313/EMBL:CCA75560.1} [Serendipita indica DSM 11827]CCA75560.1 hypothetical protein PIIN_09550 [Serendipita indica DSM 11827]